MKGKFLILSCMLVGCSALAQKADVDTLNLNNLMVLGQAKAAVEAHSAKCHHCLCRRDREQP